MHLLRLPPICARLRTILTVALLLALGVSASSGHDTWLQPLERQIPVGATLTLDLTSNAGFHGLDHAIQPWRVRRTFGIVAGEPFAVATKGGTEKSLRFEAKPPTDGVAMVCVELKPRPLELAEDKIEEYFEEIHAGPELRQQWLTVPEPRKWREVYTKFSKTFTAVGSTRDDGSWAKPAGFALEIIPARNPCALRQGDDFMVQVLKNGLPFAGFPLGFVSEAEQSHHVVKTDRDGRAMAKLDRAGAWLVHGTDLRRSAEPNLEWESDFVTLVVNVK